MWWLKLKKAFSFKLPTNNSQIETYHSNSPSIPSSSAFLSRFPIPPHDYSSSINQRCKNFILAPKVLI
ncbi:hypothetical protein H5410_005816 [Solanum commersonii]|uniref:Uncharacterized protein n=1 Tax=Solanum commersonii TaxID=4109 RepID=A0A9J6A7G6_SOLCO|nr:hypothetical protein H5410_005816 [Solanum commersonii]